MLEYAGSQRARRSRRHEAIDLWIVLRSLDWLLLAAVLAVVGLGIWAIGGITGHDIPGNPRYFVDRQAIYAAVGFVGLLVAALIDPDVYRRYWRWIFGGTVGAILLVFLQGQVRGSKRWISLGAFQLQPSEFGKLLFVLALAGFLTDRGRAIAKAHTVLATIGLALIPVLLVFLQPDLGTALVYAAALGAILFVAGARWLHLAALATAVVVLVVAVLWALPSAGVHVLKPYQQCRLTSFTHPTASNTACGTYNIEQSKIAVGAGGTRGRGTKGSTQTTEHFLPEHATDFVFASYAEQRGFVGASLLLGLYLLLIWRGLRIVAVARDHFSAIVAGGIVMALLFQIFVNAGMTMAIAPITGIPLPFFSVGGSSMIANLLAMGVLLAIHARGRGARFARRRG
jgi:rod shape determining protein RodA